MMAWLKSLYSLHWLKSTSREFCRKYWIPFWNSGGTSGHCCRAMRAFSALCEFDSLGLRSSRYSSLRSSWLSKSIFVKELLSIAERRASRWLSCIWSFGNRRRRNVGGHVVWGDESINPSAFQVILWLLRHSSSRRQLFLSSWSRQSIKREMCKLSKFSKNGHWLAPGTCSLLFCQIAFDIRSKEYLFLFLQKTQYGIMKKLVGKKIFSLIFLIQLLKLFSLIAIADHCRLSVHMFQRWKRVKCTWKYPTIPWGVNPPRIESLLVVLEFSVFLRKSMSSIAMNISSLLHSQSIACLGRFYQRQGLKKGRGNKVF